jgi:subtilase family serine protease/subtilisin family serine protease
MRRLGLSLLLLLVLATNSPLALSGPVLAQDAPEGELTGDFVPGQLLIRFKPGVTKTEIADFYAQYALAEKDNLDIDSADQDEGLRLVAIQVELTPSVIELMESDPRVQYAEPNYIVHISRTPNDPDYGKLWGLNNTGQTGGTAGADIDAPETWDFATGSSDVIVMVIDTGVDYRHEDLAKNMWVNPGECPNGNCVPNGRDDDNNGYIDDFYGINAINDSGDPMDDYGHGTHVAGTIGAVGNNGVGIVGVNWNVRIAACKFLSASGSGSVAGAIKCFQYTHELKTRRNQNIVLTNNSWGGPIQSEALREAMAGADQPMHVCAAGNSNSSTPHMPAGFDLENILSIAATDHNDEYASFSNYGAPWVDFAAPGVDVLSTVPKGSCPLCGPSGYETASGTSMATPHVAGALALMWSQYKTLTIPQAKQRLMAALDPLSDRSKTTLTNGRLNLLNAMENDTIPPAPVTDLAVTGLLLTKVTLTWTATGDDGMQGRANAYDLRYSTAPISDANWEQATPVAGTPAPQTPGALEQFTIGGLAPGTSYYVALKVLDNVGNSSEISNVVVAKTSAGTIVFADDMESGPSKWTTAGTDNLWHLSELRANSPTTAWYYGKEDTRNYDTGKANNGTLTSQSVDVVGADDALLTFYEWSQLQSTLRLDRTRVQVSSDGQSWQTVFESHGTEGAWVQRTVDLSPYITATGSVQVRFWFDTVDATANNFEGWYVDDVQLLTARLERPGAQTPTANLVMQPGNILVNPATPVVGEPVTLHATVLNHGSSEANDVVVQFMAVTPSGTTPIGQPQTIANIPAGGSGVAEVIYTPTALQPGSSGAGDRTIQVVVDPNNFVPETNEADNSATRILRVAAGAAANLSIKAANIGFDPPTASPGDVVTIRATIMNTGTVEARDVLVQFADVTGTGSTPLPGGVQTIPVIPPGGSSLVETTFDTAAVQGNRDIEVAVDVNNAIPETNESDNKAEKTLLLTPLFAPNLNVQATNIGANPPNPSAGQVITLYATILNDGATPASNVAVQFMELVGSSAVPLGPQQMIDLIPAGGSGLAQMMYDTTSRAGDRKIEVQVDPNNFIAETRESDNKAQKTIKVIPSAAPNLTIQAGNINANPLTPVAGELVTIYATVVNNGGVDAVDVVVQFIDTTNGASLPIGEVQTIPLIPAGGSGVAQVTMDTTGKAGDRALQVVVDPGNFILESNEADNSARDGLRIQAAPTPNLVLLANNIQFSPPMPTTQQAVTIHAVVLNNGQVDAERVLVQFIDLSTGSAMPIGNEQFVERIPAGGSGSAQVTLALTNTMPSVAGARRIQVLVDSNNLIAESNEEDNSAVKSLPVTAAAAPNLVMLAENIGFDPPHPTVGGGDSAVTISAVVLNRGTAPASNIVVQFVDISTGRPLPIGEEQLIDAIAVGGSGVAQVTMPTAGRLGDYQIRVSVDPNNLIAESDETDNKNTATLTVQSPPVANLMVQPSNLGFSPPVPTFGDAVSVTATILNNGVLAAQDVLVQFVDVTGGGFVPVGAKQTIPLIPPGGSATAQVTFDTRAAGQSGPLGGYERKIQVLVDPHTTIPESNEADNTAVQTLLIAPAAAPNLVLQETNIGINPAAPNAGDMVTVVATVLNTGDSEARQVVVQFFDATPATGGGTSSPVPIGASQVISAIAPGGSATVQVLYDTTNRPGDRRIQVMVDSANLIPESNETDNMARKTLRVAPPAIANLNIQAANIGFDPPQPAPGAQVTIIATVLNDGSAPANEVLVQFMDMTNSTTPIPIGQPQVISTIPAGGSATAQVTYDTTGLLGDRKIQVVVDPNNLVRESRETDNSIQKTVSLVATAAPNLSIVASNIGVTPASPAEGSTMTLIATVFNDGNAPADNVIVQFLDASGSQSLPIGQPQTIDTIPVGGSGSTQVSYVVPPAPPTGSPRTLRITVLVDPNNFIAESKETDNTATRTVPVASSALPNLQLVATNVGYNPPAPVAGENVLVNMVVLNTGLAPANDVTVQLMDLTDGTAVPVGAPQLIPTIPAGSSGAALVVFDTTGKAGIRQLQVIADPNNFIPELDETDNSAVAPLTVATTPAPNLKVLPGNLKFDPPAPEQGDVVTVTVTVINEGNADANDVVVQFTESRGGTSVPIGMEQTIDTIAAGSSSLLRITYANTDEPGEREITVTVDPSNIIAESDESDNMASKLLVVTPPIIANLVIQPGDLVFAPPTPTTGDPVTLTATIHNRGTGAASNVTVLFFDISEGGAEPIGEPRSLALLEPGTSQAISVTYNTEEKVGDRRIQVVVDPENTVEESNENDNVVVKTLRIVSEAEQPPPQPNITIRAEAISFNPVTATVGMPVTVTVAVTNTGAADASDVQVEFSDVTGGASEVLGRRQITGTLAAGRSSRVRLVYDTIGRSGVRTLQVAGDPDNAIEESDETDNIATRTLTMTTATTAAVSSAVDLPNLTVLAEELAVFTPDVVVNGVLPEAVTFAVTVLNTGGAPANNVAVELVVMTSQGWEVLEGTPPIPTIPAGGRVTTEVVYDLRGKSGYSEVRVMVDPDNTIAEVDETDNRASKVLQQ